MSQDHNHLSHATWECKYRVVFTPKYRKKVYSGRSGATSVFHELAHQAAEFSGSQILGRAVAIETRVLMKSHLSSRNPL